MFGAHDSTAFAFVPGQSMLSIVPFPGATHAG